MFQVNAQDQGTLMIHPAAASQDRRHTAAIAGEQPNIHNEIWRCGVPVPSLQELAQEALLSDAVGLVNVYLGRNTNLLFGQIWTSIRNNGVHRNTARATLLQFVNHPPPGYAANFVMIHHAAQARNDL